MLIFNSIVDINMSTPWIITLQCIHNVNEYYISVSVCTCVCVCACVRACVRVCVCVCV